MEENLPEDVKKLAETLKKSGLAVSDIDAIEKAKASLGAEDLLKKTQNIDNYYKWQEDKTVEEASKDTTEKTEDVTEEELPQQEAKESIEIKELKSDENAQEQAPERAEEE